jgi:hypothetical protein
VGQYGALPPARYHRVALVYLLVLRDVSGVIYVAMTPQDASLWVRRNVVFEYSKKDAILEVHAATVFPISHSEVFEILSHPLGEDIYRGISSCVKRKILENDGHGNMLLEVHNKSDWNVLGLVRGSVVSKMLVETSLQNSLLHFGLIPGTSQILNDMYGVWRCYSFCDPKLQEFLDWEGDIDPLCDVGKLRSSSLVTLYQRFEFSTETIPKVFYGAVSRAAIGQIHHSFEDLILEIWRKQAGFSSLPPLMTVIMKEIDDGEGISADGHHSVESAKSILDEKAYSYSSKSAHVNGKISHKLKNQLEDMYEDRSLGAERVQEAREDPISHPLMTRMESLALSTRMNSLNSIQSLPNLASLDAERVKSISSLTDLVDLEARSLQAEEHSQNRGYFRKVKSMIDMYMGIEVESAFDEDDEYDFGEAWLVIA